MRVTPPGPLRYAKRSHLAFSILDSFLSTVIVVVVYIYLIEPMPFSLIKFVYIFITAILSGIAGSFIARMMTHFWEFTKNIQHATRNLINGFVYAFIVWIGFVTFIFSMYDLTTFLGIAQLFISLLFIKLLVFYASDYYSDKIAFQG